MACIQLYEPKLALMLLGGMSKVGPEVLTTLMKLMISILGGFNVWTSLVMLMAAFASSGTARCLLGM